LTAERYGLWNWPIWEGHSLCFSKIILISRYLWGSSCLLDDNSYCDIKIKENIGLGDPEHAHNEHRITEAARLGGAHDFINRLPEGFETYLDRPVRDYYSGLPEGTKTLFGRPVDYGRLRGVGGMETANQNGLSGGQKQRLAVWVPQISILLVLISIA
jgi:hypothetical protein